MEPIGMPGQGGPTSEIYRFDDIVVDAGAHTVLRAGQPQTIEPKAFSVLLVLLRHKGELVTRDDLLDDVWGHRHVTPGVLTRVIAQLRHVLGDDSQHPRYIQTQHALGYRFIGLPRRDSDYPDASVKAGSVNTAGEAEPGETIVAVRQSVPASLKLAANEPHPPNGGHGHDRRHDDHVRILNRIAEQADSGGGVRRVLASLVGWGGLLALLTALAIWIAQRTQPTRAADASIAVLPFTSLSENKSDGYFADGLTVEMHDALAGVPGLKVIAAPQSGGVKQGDAKSLGAQLGVATLLDASVRREGARVRINARLTDARTGFTLWTQSYDRETSDVFGLQSEIANEVVQSLLGVLPGDGQALARRLAPTRNIAAYDAYLKGRQQLQERAGGSRSRQRDQLLPRCAGHRPWFRARPGRHLPGRDQRDSKPRAMPPLSIAPSRRASAHPAWIPACARSAWRWAICIAPEASTTRRSSITPVRLEDPALRADANIGIGPAWPVRRGTMQWHWITSSARASCVRAIPSCSASAAIHLYTSGDIAGAIESYRTAAALQPDDYRTWASLGGLYQTKGDDVQASAAFERSLQIKPNYPALSNLGTLKFDSRCLRRSGGPVPSRRRAGPERFPPVGQHRRRPFGCVGGSRRGAGVLPGGGPAGRALPEDQARRCAGFRATGLVQRQRGRQGESAGDAAQGRGAGDRARRGRAVGRADDGGTGRRQSRRANKWPRHAPREFRSSGSNPFPCCGD